MFKYELKYTNSEGAEIKKNLYFNLTKAEVIKMDLARNGNLKEIIEGVVASADQEAMLYWFDKIITLSYGERTPDGVFIKTPEKTAAFNASEDYSEFYIKLLTQEINPQQFIMGIFPKDIAAQMEQQIK